MLLGLIIAVYFLYKEVNFLRNKMIELEDSVSKKLLELPQPSYNQLPPSYQLAPNNYNYINEDIINYQIPKQDIVNIDLEKIEKLTPIKEIVETPIVNTILPNESCTLTTELENTEDDTTIEETGNIVETYSNDNKFVESESIKSLEENESLEEFEPSILLRNNKLAELQYLAESLKIDIKKENGKKKTKLQLANEIFDTKKNKNI